MKTVEEILDGKEFVVVDGQIAYTKAAVIMAMLEYAAQFVNK